MELIKIIIEYTPYFIPAAWLTLFEMLTIAALFYLFYTSIFTWMVNYLEYRVNVDIRQGG